MCVFAIKLARKFSAKFPIRQKRCEPEEFKALCALAEQSCVMGIDYRCTGQGDGDGTLRGAWEMVEKWWSYPMKSRFWFVDEENEETATDEMVLIPFICTRWMRKMSIGDEKRWKTLVSYFWTNLFWPGAQTTSYLAGNKRGNGKLHHHHHHHHHHDVWWERQRWYSWRILQ